MKSFLFFCCFGVFLGQFLVPSIQNSNRFKQIMLPVKESLYGNGLVHGENFILSPFLKVLSGSNLDLCLDVKRRMQLVNPEIWNSSQVKNPCEKYFCQIQRPILKDNSSLYVDISEPLETKDVLHHTLQTYCTMCEDSYGQRFDEVLRNTSCPWFNAKSCNHTTDRNITCIYFSSIHPLYYSGSTNSFYAKLNIFHTGYLQFRYYYYVILYFLPNIFFFIFNIMFLIIPELFYLNQIKKEFISKVDAIKTIFNLRNQSVIMELAISFAYIIASILDFLGFALTSFVNVVQYFQFLSILFSWTNLIILWHNIYNQSEASSINNLKLWHYIAWIGLLVYSIVVFFLIIILFILLAFLSSNLVFHICFALIFVVCSILMLIVAVVLMIMSIRIYFIITKNQNESFFQTFKLKLTRNIFLFTFLVMFAFVLSVIGAACQVWPDLITWEGYGIFWVWGVIFLSNSFTFLSILTLLNDEKIKMLYCSCKKN